MTSEQNEQQITNQRIDYDIMNHYVNTVRQQECTCSFDRGNNVRTGSFNRCKRCQIILDWGRRTPPSRV